MLGMIAVLAACTVALGPIMMLKLYVLPYWINVMWLDAVTYLHHHAPSDENEKIPWCVRSGARLGDMHAAGLHLKVTKSQNLSGFLRGRGGGSLASGCC
jgi:hypothetical protein